MVIRCVLNDLGWSLGTNQYLRLYCPITPDDNVLFHPKTSLEKRYQENRASKLHPRALNHAQVHGDIMRLNTAQTSRKKPPINSE
jgi:hypothetical protein